MSEVIVEAIVFAAISGVFVLRAKQDRERVLREHEQALKQLKDALATSEQEVERLRVQADQSASELVEVREFLKSSASADDGIAAKALATADQAAQMLEVERRKSRELFMVVESVLKERDQWKDMWFTQSREHLNAQNALEHAVEQARMWLRAALVAVNKHREEKGLAPIPFGLDPKDPPVGTAAQFEKLILEAQRTAPEHVDGVALRDRVVAAAEAEK